MFCKKNAWLSALLLGGCAGGYVPPVSLSAGFFGASVTVSEPGFTVPAKVIPTAAVVTPTLMVPSDAPKTSGSVPVVNSQGVTATVPVTVSPVTEPVLVIPVEK